MLIRQKEKLRFREGRDSPASCSKKNSRLVPVHTQPLPSTAVHPIWSISPAPQGGAGMCWPPRISGVYLRACVEERGPDPWTRACPQLPAPPVSPAAFERLQKQPDMLRDTTRSAPRLHGRAQPLPHGNTDRALPLVDTRAVAIVAGGTMWGEFNKNPFENGISFS